MKEQPEHNHVQKHSVQTNYSGSTSNKEHINPNGLKNIKFKHVWQTNKYFKWGTSYATTKTRVLIPLVPSSVGK